MCLATHMERSDSKNRNKCPGCWLTQVLCDVVRYIGFLPPSTLTTLCLLNSIFMVAMWLLKLRSSHLHLIWEGVCVCACVVGGWSRQLHLSLS